MIFALVLVGILIYVIYQYIYVPRHARHWCLKPTTEENYDEPQSKEIEHVEHLSIEVQEVDGVTKQEYAVNSEEQIDFDGIIPDVKYTMELILDHSSEESTKEVTKNKDVSHSQEEMPTNDADKDTVTRTVEKISEDVIEDGYSSRDQQVSHRDVVLVNPEIYDMQETDHENHTTDVDREEKMTNDIEDDGIEYKRERVEDGIKTQCSFHNHEIIDAREISDVSRTMDVDIQ